MRTKNNNLPKSFLFFCIKIIVPCLRKWEDPAPFQFLPFFVSKRSRRIPLLFRRTLSNKLPTMLKQRHYKTIEAIARKTRTDPSRSVSSGRVDNNLVEPDTRYVTCDLGNASWMRCNFYMRRSRGNAFLLLSIKSDRSLLFFNCEHRQISRM